VTDFADGAVAIVGGDQHQDGGAAGPVTFIGDLVDLAAFQFAGATHDGFIDVVRRHGDPFSGDNRGTQTGIAVGIATGTGGDLNLFDKACERFTALGVEGGFLVLDRRPF